MQARRRAAAFVLVGAGGFAVQVGIFVLLDTVGWPTLLASAASIAAAIVHNFAWHRNWTWADRDVRRGTIARFVEFAVATGAISFGCNVVFVTLGTRLSHVNPLAWITGAVVAASVLNFAINDCVIFRRPR